MAKKELEKSESSQSARLQIYEFQVHGDEVSRIPSAKSQDMFASHSSAKIIGLAGLKPVLGLSNATERETMNEYLLKRILQRKTGNDVDADDQLPAIPPDSFRDYIEEMLRSPKNLEELITAKDPSFQYDRKTGESWLMALAEETTKKSDGEGKSRLLTAGWKETRNRDATRSANLKDAAVKGVETDLAPESDPHATLKGMRVVGVQMAVPIDPLTVQSSLDPSTASSRRQSGKMRKGEGKDEGTWSPASSEIKVNDDEDHRGSTGTTRTSDGIGRESLTADASSGRRTLKPAQGRESETAAPGESPLGRKSKRKKSHDRPSSDKTSRKSSKIQKASKGRNVASAKQSEGRKVSSAKQSVGQQVTSAKHSPGRKVTSARQSEGQKVTSARKSEGQKVTSARQSQGQKVTTVKKSKGQKVAPETSADIESDVGEPRGALKKEKTKKKDKGTASDPVRDSVEGDDALGQSRQIKAPLDGKLSELEDLPPSSTMEGMAVEASLPTKSAPSRAGGKEESGLKKNAKKRAMKTKAAPRTIIPKQSITIDGHPLEEPDWDPSLEPDLEIPEMDLIEHLLLEDAPRDSLEHSGDHSGDHSAEPMHGGPGQVQLMTHDVVPSKGPGTVAISQSQDPLHLFQQLCLIRQTLKDNIFFGYYFTRAFVFSYFRTKPSHYDPNTSVPPLRSDVLDAAQRRLLRDLVADPYRFRCLRDVRAVERMLALAKTAARQTNAESPIARHLDRLPDLLGHTLKT